MATRAPKAVVIPTPKVIEDALALSARFRDVEGLSRHVAGRKPLLQGAAAALAVLGAGCGAGVFVYLAGLSTSLTLPAVLLAPLVTLGSLFVIFFVFFSWIEGRALAQALGHRTGPRPGPLARWLRKKLRADLGSMPPVPWLPAALFVAGPLILLILAAPVAAVLLLLIGAAIPIVYARLDAA